MVFIVMCLLDWCAAGWVGLVNRVPVLWSSSPAGVLVRLQWFVNTVAGVPALWQRRIGPAPGPPIHHPCEV